MSTVCQQTVPVEKRRGYVRTNNLPKCGALPVPCEPAGYTVCSVHAKLAGYYRCPGPECPTWIKSPATLCSSCGTRAALAHG